MVQKMDPQKGLGILEQAKNERLPKERSVPKRGFVIELEQAEIEKMRLLIASRSSP